MAGKQNPAVQAALRLIDEGMTPYSAAQQAGAVQASVYSALKRRQGAAVAPVPGDDPEAVLRAMAQAGQVEAVSLIAGRLFLLCEELRQVGKRKV